MKYKAYKLKKDLPHIKAGAIFRWASFFGTFVCTDTTYGATSFTTESMDSDMFEPYFEDEDKKIEPINKAQIRELPTPLAHMLLVDKINEIIEKLEIKK